MTGGPPPHPIPRTCSRSKPSSKAERGSATNAVTPPARASGTTAFIARRREAAPLLWRRGSDLRAPELAGALSMKGRLAASAVARAIPMAICACGRRGGADGASRARRSRRLSAVGVCCTSGSARSSNQTPGVGCLLERTRLTAEATEPALSWWRCSMSDECVCGELRYICGAGRCPARVLPRIICVRRFWAPGGPPVSGGFVTASAGGRGIGRDGNPGPSGASFALRRGGLRDGACGTSPGWLAVAVRGPCAPGCAGVHQHVQYVADRRLARES